MQFSKPDCPECGKKAADMLESLYAWAHLNYFEDADVFDYQGGSKVDWDSQEPDENKEGKVQLQCPAGHQWDSEVDYSDPEEKPNGETPSQA